MSGVKEQERADNPEYPVIDDVVLQTMQRMATRYYRHGMYADSESLLAFLLRHQSSHPEIYFDMGKAKHAQARYAEALTNYRRAITLGLPDLEVYLYMGQCCIFLDLYAQADSALRQFLSLGRADPSSQSIPLLVRAQNLLDDLVTPRLQQPLEGTG
ncbi:MAG: hypothetical protein VW831_06755 [Gammaproteobacteria bacterium]